MANALEILPPEKQVYEDRYAQERELGFQNPAIREPSYTPEPGPVYPLEIGIINDGDPPPGSEDFIFTNRWQDYVDSSFVIVFAGGVKSDQAQGKLLVQTFIGQDQIPIDEYLTPIKNGAVRIESVSNLQLRLMSSSGGVFLFDVPSRTFTIRYITYLPINIKY
jgi:hypothetical protein